MLDSTKIALARIAGGVALLITYAVTGVDGTLIMVALILLGIPVEQIKTAKIEEKC